MQDKLGSATPSPNQEQQTSPAGSPQCSPLSCTSAPPTQLGLGPNLSPPFVLPPPPVEAGALSPNLFPLNAHFLPREPFTTSVGIASHRRCSGMRCLHLHSATFFLFVFLPCLVTQENRIVFATYFHPSSRFAILKFQGSLRGLLLLGITRAASSNLFLLPT